MTFVNCAVDLFIQKCPWSKGHVTTQGIIPLRQHILTAGASKPLYYAGVFEQR